LDFRDVTLQAIDDFSTQLDVALDGLTPEQWRWRPTPTANHILWTVWHLTRIEDAWVNWYLSDNGEIWKTRGWAEKFGMPADDNYGMGYTSEEIETFPDVAPEIVAGYRAAVHKTVQPVIRSLSAADLETSHPDKNPLHPRPACPNGHMGPGAYLGGVFTAHRSGRIHKGPDPWPRELAELNAMHAASLCSLSPCRRGLG
jgi:hypothetical protein